MKTKRERMSLDTVLSAVMQYYGVDYDDLIERNRKREIIRPRQMFFYIARRYTDFSYEAIGKKLKRDHATALYAFQKYDSMMYPDDEMEFNGVMSVLTGDSMSSPEIRMFNSLGFAFKILGTSADYELKNLGTGDREGVSQASEKGFLASEKGFLASEKGFQSTRHSTNMSVW